MLAIVVNLEIKPATEEQAIAALEANAAGSRQEPGCLKWEWSRKLDEPTHFAIYELYRDQAAIDAHRTSPHFLRWDQSLPGLGRLRPTSRPSLWHPQGIRAAHKRD